MEPARNTALALLRGAGSLGASFHGENVPAVNALVMTTLSVAVFPSEPPTYRIFVPAWTVAPSMRGAGRLSSGGETSHGMAAPGGAGHGSVRFSGGQRLTGEIALMPMSIV